MSPVCWACRHPEVSHDSLGCAVVVETRSLSTDDDGIVTEHLDASECGCPYFKGSLT